MALNNETFTVSTNTGNVAVPIETLVPYSNIELIGYQYYGYHKVMAQNLVTITDEIKALQDGGAAAATFDAAALVNDTKAQIATEVLSLETGINTKIKNLTDEAVETTISKLNNFDTILNGDGGVSNIGVVGQVTALSEEIGNNDSGIIKKLNTLVTTIGGTDSGLVQQANAISSAATTTSGVIASQDDRLNALENSLTDSTNGVLSKLNALVTIVGDADSGLVKSVQTYNGLETIIGNTTSGLIYQVNSLETKVNDNITSDNNRLTTLESSMGLLGDSGVTHSISDLSTQTSTMSALIGSDETLGLRGRVSTIENYDIPSIADSITNSETGILKTINDNSEALSLITGTATSNISDLISKVATNTSDISTVQEAAAANTTAINNISTTFFTYDTTTVTPAMLISTYNIAHDVASNNIISKFNAYFKTTLADGTVSYVADNEVGKGYLDSWIADTTTSGYESKTKEIIGAYINADATISSFTEISTAISTLTGEETEAGSVKYIAAAAVTTKFNDYTALTTSTLETLNGEATTIGSIKYSINDAVSPLETNISNNATNIDILKNDLKQSIDETQIEMVRYDTILPFLQKMFKYVNVGNKISDTQIDDVFNLIQSNIDTLSNSYNTSQYKIKFIPSTDSTIPSTFGITIVLDKDLKFTHIAEDIAYIKIVDTSNPTLSTDLLSDDNATIVDSAGNLILNSGIYVQIVDAVLYNDSGDVDHNILDITTAPDNALELQFATIDSFGFTKLIKIAIT